MMWSCGCSLALYIPLPFACLMTVICCVAAPQPIMISSIVILVFVFLINSLVLQAEAAQRIRHSLLEFHHPQEVQRYLDEFLVYLFLVKKTSFQDYNKSK